MSNKKHIRTVRMEKISIRKAGLPDYNALWEIIRPIIEKGDSYVFYPDTDKSTMLNYWCGVNTNCYVATIHGEVVGTFILKDNQPDLGSHVANASYMTHPEHGGKGIGRAMGEYSISEAKRLGYRAMQFNMVVASNKAAIQLWESLGFSAVGEIPEAFRHKEEGLTDVKIMWKKLDETIKL